MAPAEMTNGMMPGRDDKAMQLQDPAAVESDNEMLLQGVDEKKLLRKLDLHIIPLVMALYLFSFLDR